MTAFNFFLLSLALAGYDPQRPIRQQPCSFRAPLARFSISTSSGVVKNTGIAWAVVHGLAFLDLLDGCPVGQMLAKQARGAGRQAKQMSPPQLCDSPNELNDTTALNQLPRPR